MKPDIIVMLTHNDVTVPDGLEIFESCKDLPVKDWGFKNVGPSYEDRMAIARAMKAAGKTLYYEVISYNDDAYREAAEFAAEAGVDVVTGTKYSPLLHGLLKEAGIGYSPFVGKVGCVWNGRSGMLMGDYDEIAAEGVDLIKNKGTTGLDVSAYRHIESPEKVISTLRAALPDAHICIAGSVDSFEKIDFLAENNIDKFTMGSALFNKLFVPDGSFRDNLQVIVDYLAK